MQTFPTCYTCGGYLFGQCLDVFASDICICSYNYPCGTFAGSTSQCEDACTNDNALDSLCFGIGDASVGKRSIGSEGGYFAVPIGKAGVGHAAANTTSVNGISGTAAIASSAAPANGNAGRKGCGCQIALFALVMLSTLAVRV